MTDQPILLVEDLTTRLKVGNEIWTIVDHLNFSLHKSRTLALVGESGCGKSISALSLMRILPQPPEFFVEGKVWYRNQNILTLKEKEMRSLRGSKIAMIFQNPMSALNPVFTIGNQLVEALELHTDYSDEESKSRAIEALDAVGISQPEKRFFDYPHQLSGGLRQRVMIAMALICEPDILIADEPTTALDTTIQAQVLKLIRQFQEKNGLALLLITHDMGVVAEMADEVLVMYTAQCVERAPVKNLFDLPAHPYTEGLFNSRPSVQLGKGKLKCIPGHVPSFQHIPAGCRFHPRCPYAMPKCSKGQVPDFMINDTSHCVKCWLYDSSHESAEKLNARGNV